MIWRNPVFGVEKMAITLIGYRGCGKSSVGPLLAERLGWTCIDCDDQIELNAAKSIREIFEDDGESAFRALETTVLTRLLHGQRVVVAAGGGAVLADQNRRCMRESGPVIWLQASADVLARRIGCDDNSTTRRPGLTGKSAVDEVSEVLQSRLPLYSEATTFSVDTEDRSPTEIVDEIMGRLESLDFGIIDR